MQTLKFIRINIVPNIIKYIINYTLLIWKTWKLQIDKQTYFNISIIDIIKKNININKTVIWSYNINFKWSIEIDKYSNVNWPNTYLLWCSNYKIKIWKFCSIAPNVTIISSNNHDYSKLTITPWPIWLNNINIWGDVIIWNDVWIWTNVVIFPWIKIGNWAIIWAWSIINKDIEPYSINVWNPTKNIKYRFNEKTINLIEKSEWWNWDLEKIKNNYNLEFIKNEGQKNFNINTWN